MLEIFILIFLIGFLLKYIDLTLGGSYGTVLTPFLLLLGYSLPTIVPIILLADFLTSIVGGVWYKKFGNVSSKAVLFIVLPASIGTVIAIIFAIIIPKFWLNLYIGLLTLLLGIFMFLKYYREKKSTNVKQVSSWKMVLISGLLGFNKALSGGEFGPISTASLALAGYEVKKCIGSTTLSKGIVCLVGFACYLLLNGIHSINWGLATSLIFGSLLATYPAVYTTIKIPKKTLGILVSIAIIFLGIFTLVRLII
jgi:uncharacterized membrane protein YfcA